MFLGLVSRFLPSSEISSLVTHKARLASGVLLAAMLTIGGAAALESSAAFPLMDQSVTGSYLAGRQALSDLRTGDAARYFRTAAEGDWDNPIIVERSFIAYAANGQVSDAARVAKHLLELSAPNDLASLVIGTEAVKQRRYAAAAKELENVCLLYTSPSPRDS